MAHYHTPKHYNNTPTHHQSHYHNSVTPNPQYALNDVRQLPASSHKRKRSESYSSSASTDKSYESDSDGVIDISVGDTVQQRYIITAYAGSGTFGTVYECIDTAVPHTSPQYKCAIKIVRSVQRYSDAAYVEADILQQLHLFDTEPYTSQCVKLYNVIQFTHRGSRHVGLVFELLGQSLYSFLKHNHYQPYSSALLKRFAYQIIKSVLFCHEHKLIHTDLKLENVLLVNSDYTGQHNTRVPVHTELRLIDFGGSIFEHEYHSTMIQTRQYRAPEVVLNTGWSYAADIWSIGCILAECATGSLLFATHNDIEHVQLIERITEQPFPQHMIAAALAKYANKHGSRQPLDSDTLIKQWQYSATMHTAASYNNTQHVRDTSVESRQSRSPSTVQLDKIFDMNTGMQYWPSNALNTASIQHVQQQQTLSAMFKASDAQLYDLMCGLLQIDPARRLTAAQALQHEYFDSIRLEMQEVEKQLLQRRAQLHIQYIDIDKQRHASDRQSRERRSGSRYSRRSYSNEYKLEYNKNDVRLKRYRSRHDSRYDQRYRHDVRHLSAAKRSSQRSRSRSPRHTYRSTSSKYASNDVRSAVSTLLDVRHNNGRKSSYR